MSASRCDPKPQARSVAAERDRAVLVSVEFARERRRLGAAARTARSADVVAEPGVEQINTLLAEEQTPR